MPRPAQLEVFDTGPQLLQEAPLGPSEEWQEGHAAGFEEARQLAAADSTELRAELVQTLSDMAFGYAEAKAELLRQLEPLFDALIAGFLPGLAAQSLVPLIGERLRAAAADALDQPLVLRVAPGQIVAVSDALAQEAQLPFTAQSDPALGPGQALISGATTGEMIDLDAVLTLTQETLAALRDTNQERVQHG